MESLPLSDFPSDVQLMILSFLSPSDVSSLACTSRRFSSLPSDPDLWLSMLLRRWGLHTHIPSWAHHSSLPLPRLYSALHRWDPLLGFWRGIGRSSPFLLLFHWGPSFLTASKLLPFRLQAPPLPLLLRWGPLRPPDPFPLARPLPGRRPRRLPPPRPRPSLLLVLGPTV